MKSTRLNIVLGFFCLLVSAFLLSAAWEYGLKDTVFGLPSSIDIDTGDRLRIILTSVLFAAIALVLPLFFMLRADGTLTVSNNNLLRSRAETVELARYDPLTGLGNRKHFTEALDLLIERKPDDGFCHCLFLLDVSNLGDINDAYGHLAGDEILFEVSKRLRKAAGFGLFVARIGGDEFAVLAKDLPYPQDTIVLSNKLLSAFDAPFMINRIEHPIGTAMGVASYPNDAETSTELLRRADVALARAKAETQTIVRFFEPVMDRVDQSRTATKEALRKALLAGKIVPHYQPIIKLETGRVVGFEALARWDDPEHSRPPSEFIPLAEEGSLIQDLTETMFEQACQDAASWPSDIGLSVNLSPVLLNSRVIGPKILEILARTQFAPSRLTVEITESAAVGDQSLANSFIETMRQAGVRFALDDFGTGFSSIYHLKALHFDTIKIDRSYITPLGTDGENDAIVRAILGLAKGLGITVTAEGIETDAQRQILTAEHCAQGQGYLFHKPMNRNDANLFLRSEKARPSHAA